MKIQNSAGWTMIQTQCPHGLTDSNNDTDDNSDTDTNIGTKI